MSESDLYPPVREWLLSCGYEVHVEMFDADVIAVKDGQLTVVELKRCLSKELMQQLIARAGWADYVYAAIASSPRSISGLRYHGFGYLDLSSGSARRRLSAKPQPWMWHKRHDYRMKKLNGRAPAQPHELAGLPACRDLRLQRLNRLNRTPITTPETNAC